MDENYDKLANTAYNLHIAGKLDEAKLREICLKKLSIFVSKKLAKDTAALMKRAGKK